MADEGDTLPGEMVCRVIRPHPMALAYRWTLAALFWAAAVIIGRIATTEEWYGSSSDFAIPLPSFVPQAMLLTLAILVMWLVSAAASYGMWKRRWALFVPVLIIGLALTGQKDPAGIPLIPLYLVMVGTVVAITSEVDRRSYTYTITTGRLIMTRKLLVITQRQVRIENIMDLVTNQGFLGRLFGFGTVSPITSTHLGMGDKNSALMVGGGVKGPLGKGGIIVAKTGGRSKKEPDEDPSLTLLGVPNPRDVVSLIALLMNDASPSTELKQIRTILEADGPSSANEANGPKPAQMSLGGEA
jgi:hypothetical protein